jgi:hypothetical protein
LASLSSVFARSPSSRRGSSCASRSSRSASARPGPANSEQALHTIELAITGLNQRGADLGLLERDFEDAALPLELCLRGLDAQPALQRSA